jgi:hypothetical protein
MRHISCPRSVTSAKRLKYDPWTQNLQAVATISHEEECLSSNAGSHHSQPNDPRRGSNAYSSSHHQSSRNSARMALRKNPGLPKIRFHDVADSLACSGMRKPVFRFLFSSDVYNRSISMQRFPTHPRRSVRSGLATVFLI